MASHQQSDRAAAAIKRQHAQERQRVTQETPEQRRSDQQTARVQAELARRRRFGRP